MPSHSSAAQEQLAVRLINVNGTGPGAQYEGRVEIYYNSEWGTICDNDWTFEDTQVIPVLSIARPRQLFGCGFRH